MAWWQLDEIFAVCTTWGCLQRLLKIVQNTACGCRGLWVLFSQVTAFGSYTGCWFFSRHNSRYQFWLQHLRDLGILLPYKPTNPLRSSDRGFLTIPPLDGGEGHGSEKKVRLDGSTSIVELLPFGINCPLFGDTFGEPLRPFSSWWFLI